MAGTDSGGGEVAENVSEPAEVEFDVKAYLLGVMGRSREPPDRLIPLTVIYIGKQPGYIGGHFSLDHKSKTKSLEFLKIH